MQIYDLAIRAKHMSFMELEECDILGYIDFLDYIVNRKIEDNDAMDEDDFVNEVRR